MQYRNSGNLSYNNVSISYNHFTGAEWFSLGNVGVSSFAVRETVICFALHMPHFYYVILCSLRFPGKPTHSSAYVTNEKDTQTSGLSLPVKTAIDTQTARISKCSLHIFHPF
jgi:hypothetical protein